jgi:hypothetical protein
MSTSISALRFVLGGFMCATTACADEPSSDGDAGDASSTGDGSSGDVSSSESSSSAVDDSSSASDDSSGAAGDTGEPMPGWTLDSNLNVNDQDIEAAVVSAVAVQAEYDGVLYTSIVFTNVPAYCDALAAMDCGPQGETFTFTLSFTGAEPGTYDVAGGMVSVSFGDLTESCLGGGFGASSGTITLSRVDTVPGGLVEATFDAQFDFLGGYASGSVVAPICE